MCESTSNCSTYENKIKVVAELRTDDFSEFLNAIPAADLHMFISDEVFEQWAETNGYIKTVNA